jgi:hypothetical protein
MTNLLILAKLYNMAMDMATKYATVTKNEEALGDFIALFDKLFNQLDLMN